MIIWVLIIVASAKGPVFINTFDSEVKCERFYKQLSPGYRHKCLKTELNK